MDRMAGLQDLQDEGLGLSCGLTMDRISGLTGLWVNNGQDGRI